MVYNLTEKLKFSEDPVLQIKDTKLTIKSDAETVLKLLDVIGSKGEVAAAKEAFALLLSPADNKKLSALKLNMDDYITAMKAAAQLAMGSDPDEEDAGE